MRQEKDGHKMSNKFATIVISDHEYKVLNNMLVREGFACLKMAKAGECGEGGAEKCFDFLVQTMLIKKLKLAFGKKCDPLPDEWQKRVDVVSQIISGGSFVSDKIKNCN